MSQTWLPSQEKAIGDRSVRFGFYRDDFAQINLLDTPTLAHWPRFWRRLRLKTWQHFCAITERFWISVSIVNAHHAGTCWCYVFDRKRQQLFEHKWMLPCFAVHVAQNHDGGKTYVNLPGYHTSIQNDLALKQHLIEIQIEASKFHPQAKPAMRGQWVAHEDSQSVQPLVLLKEIFKGRIFYTHKGPCPLEGWFELGDEHIELRPDRDVGIIDIHAAYYPFKTLWNWATFAYLDEQGQMRGVNLTEGTAFPRENALNENVIWMGNRMIPLSHAHFEIPSDPTAPWQIHTFNQEVELQFQPMGLRRESLHLGPIISDYRQPFGYFDGYIKDEQGEKHAIEKAFGCTEKHIATW